MSSNQSKSDKSEQHYRKTGRSTRFNRKRTTSGDNGKGAGGLPAPSPSPSSNRSFKKSINVQGGQSKVTSPAVNSSNAPSVSNVQNGPHVQPPIHANASPAVSPLESATSQRSTRAVPKAPTYQPATVSSDSTFPTTPSKASGDASKAFSVQFGSQSPGFMNGMQVSVRSSSAPPNLDEQKPAQARHDSSFRYVPKMPTPVPKQQQPKKDSVPTVQSDFGEAHPMPKVKKDAQAFVASPTKQTEKPSHPMPMPFHKQQQVSMQLGGPNPQFQSPASIQLPIHVPLPMGNASLVQQQVLVPGLQAHPLPPQRMMHQGQSLNFLPSIGGQLPLHLGNMGMGIAPRYHPNVQFGSISPGFMNGMQIPPRTSSASPNLYEQKCAQARHDSSLRSIPDTPTPVPKQPQPRKDSVPTVQSNSGEAHPEPKVKKDAQASVASPTKKTQKLSHPMQIPFHHQQQVPMQFGGPNPQIQSPASIQMPMHMPLTLGNAPQVQQQVRVPGLQAHQLPPQGMMHQGQGLSFSPPLGGQLPPHLGNAGMGIVPQYPQQQGGNFGVSRKTTPVKITHPDTHEELRLDKRTDSYSDGAPSGPGSHPNVLSQSQPIPSFGPSHSINYYSNSMFYPPPSSLPFSSRQIAPTAQGPRFNYPVSHGHQNISFMNSAAAHGSVPGSVKVTVKPCTVSVGEKVADSSLSSSLQAVEKGSSVQQPKSGTESLTSKSLSATAKDSGLAPATNLDDSLSSNSKSSASAVTAEESMLVIASNEARKENLSMSNSSKNYQKTTSEKGLIQPVNQCTPTSNLTSHTTEYGTSSAGGVSETIEAKTPADVLSQHTRELPTINDASPRSLEQKTESKREGITSLSSDVSGTGSNVDSLDMVQHSKEDGSSKLDEQLEPEISGIKGDGKTSPEVHLTDNATLEIPSQPATLNSKELKSNKGSALRKTATSNVPTSETSQRILNEDVGVNVENERVTHSRDVSPSRISGTTDVEGSLVYKAIGSDASFSAAGSNQISVTKSVAPDQQFDPVPALDLSEQTSKYEREGVRVPSMEKLVPELGSTKSSTTRGKKKIKEILRKADAAGTTSDLYMAYKGPEEKEETVVSAENNSVGLNLKQTSHESPHENAIEREKTVENKDEPDDWEDSADDSTLQLGTSDIDEKVHRGLVNTTKKYSRDFLLKFSEKCTDLPLGFVVASDFIEAFMITNANANPSHFVDRDSYSNTGRTIDRQFSGHRQDFRASGMANDDRWSRQPGSFGPGSDLRFDLGYGADAGFRPGQGGNFGGLRHPRGQAPLAYIGGILGGPMQPMGPQGGMPYNSPDSSRWQRATNYQQRGLIPSPQTPLQMMHKAERKYEVGTVAGEEESKQRQLKAILNKLTPQNFEKLFEQVKAVNIDNAVTLTGVISQIFDKALMEPTFCEMYANFCYYLAGELPDFSQDNEKITFKRLLLNKCQEEFERGEREQEEANKVEEEGEAKQSEEEREEKRIKARRRMLGNIRLIGELYKKKMLTERIMHECIKKLLGEYENPDEEDVEALCKLMSTIGDMIDHPKAKVHMDAYFERMAKLSNNMKLSSRVRFMLKDSIDLRKNKWQQRRKVEGPKKIDEVHRDAAQERQAQASRLAHSPGMNAPTRRAPMEFRPRGSMLSSPGSQMGSFRGMPSQARGFGGWDVRMDDRHSFEAKNFSVHLPERPVGNDSITLGPQGGLARGMSFRGPGVSNAPLSEASLASGDPRRVATGLHGSNSFSGQAAYGSREDLMPRYGTNRSTGPTGYDHFSSHERGLSFGNKEPRTTDHSFDIIPPAASAAQGQKSSFTQDVPSEKGRSEEVLHDMSMSTIKEYYSARDEKEVALCIKDMNSPSFHPSMIALFVTDSFERKDMERDLLAKLLVNLTRSNDGVLSQVQLVKGFESVLSTLEDAVNDAPKAAEFLGRIFGKMITENVMSLREIGRLIYEGGEEPGRLRGIGLAGDVLGSTLGVIKTEKGESAVNEIRASSDLWLEDFRPPHPYKSRLLETFIS